MNNDEFKVGDVWQNKNNEDKIRVNAVGFENILSSVISKNGSFSPDKEMKRTKDVIKNNYKLIERDGEKVEEVLEPFSWKNRGRYEFSNTDNKGVIVYLKSEVPGMHCFKDRQEVEVFLRRMKLNALILRYKQALEEDSFNNGSFTIGYDHSKSSFLCFNCISNLEHINSIFFMTKENAKKVVDALNRLDAWNRINDINLDDLDCEEDETEMQ